MKIAISTLVGYFNYGNRLQNYALQEILEEMGHSVVTIRDYTDTTQHVTVNKKIIESIKSGEFLKKAFKKIINNKKKKLNVTREENFKKFTADYIHESDFYIDQRTTDFTFDENFDCYVIGSDQVWNYNFPTFSKLNFVEYSNKPKISYAASFGVSEIPHEYIPLYRKGLDGIDYISVRETDGEKIVKSITKKNAIVVLDPTLLLKRENWEKITSRYSDEGEDYILMYFLDGVSSEDFQYIKKFAAKRNLKIKNLFSMNDIDLWTADPGKFISLISHAQGIFTDSFHGSVFSVIFERYFEVFPRNNHGPSMNSRIDTLLKDLGLLDRWHNQNVTKDIQNINYSAVNEKLNIRRKESLDFLNGALIKIQKRNNTIL